MAPSSSKSSLSNGGGAGKNEKTANRKGGAVKMEPAEAPVSDINPATATQTQTELHDYVWLSGAALVLYKVLKTAYEIRLTSIREYGPVIHEYDPYFNYRATEVSQIKHSNCIKALEKWNWNHKLKLCSHVGQSVSQYMYLNLFLYLSLFSILYHCSIYIGMARKSSSSGLIIWFGIH
jgi:hypothetical protein